LLLGQLAHNVVVWARRWLSQNDLKLARFGVLRLVRDLFSTSGFTSSPLVAESKP